MKAMTIDLHTTPDTGVIVPVNVVHAHHEGQEEGHKGHHELQHILKHTDYHGLVHADTHRSSETLKKSININSFCDPLAHHETHRSSRSSEHLETHISFL